MQLVNPQKPVQSAAYLVIAVLSAVTLAAEPLATALIGLVVAFGLTMSQEQIDALVTVVRIVAQILVSAGVVQYAATATKAQVTPMANPTLPEGAEVNVLGTEDSVVIAPTPPGPAGVPGGGGAAAEAGLDT